MNNDDDEISSVDKPPNEPPTKKVFYCYGLGGKLYRWADDKWLPTEPGTTPMQASRRE